MPMCIAMLQNQAKNITCQNVNLTWPGSGSPPFQMWVVARRQKSAAESTSALGGVDELPQRHQAKRDEHERHPGRGDVGHAGDEGVAVHRHDGREQPDRKHRGNPAALTSHASVLGIDQTDRSSDW